MKKVLTIILVVSQLLMSSDSKSPFVVYNASNGVVLHSRHLKDSIITPVRGTEVYLEDTFELRDERYEVRIKDTKSGEIFSFSGKAIVTPKQIVDASKVTLFRRFLSFIALQAEEFGFNISPVYTSQCVSYKGHIESSGDTLSQDISLQIKSSIVDSVYCDDIRCSKILNGDGTYYYSIKNMSSTDYGFVLYTVGADNICYDHSSVVLSLSDIYAYDEIEYMLLVKNSTLDLTYISMAEEDLKNTCYVIVFNPKDFYLQSDAGHYVAKIDWSLVEKELVNQGGSEYVIRIDK